MKHHASVEGEGFRLAFEASRLNRRRSSVKKRAGRIQMIRRFWLGLVVLIIGGRPAAGQPAKDLTQYSFEGQLVYRADDGSLIPVVPNTVLVGWGDGRCQFTLQSVENLKVASDGSFRVLVGEKTVATTRDAPFKPDNSAAVPTCVETKSWPCYRFRAAGCNDGIMEFDPKPPERVIELGCPGRTNARRDG